MASLAAQSSTHLSDGKVMQNKSYQTLNAMPSTHSNAESHNEKAAKSMAKAGGAAGTVTLSTSLNMPSHQSNDAATTQQQRSST